MVSLTLLLSRDQRLRMPTGAAPVGKHGLVRRAKARRPREIPAAMAIASGGGIAVDRRRGISGGGDQHSDAAG